MSNKFKWFHSIDLGDEITNSRFRSTTPPNFTLFGFYEIAKDLNFAGLTCVDVGTMDGLAAFVMKSKGAAKVIATDLAERKSFEHAREKLGLDIEYRVPVQAVDLPELLKDDKPDLIHLSGILYHVIDPLDVILACRYALPTDGLLVIETMYDPFRGTPTMVFNPTEVSIASVDRANVFWRPSKRALEGMLAFAGFEVIKCVMNDTRITFLAVARRPSDIAKSDSRLSHIFSHYGKYRNYKENLDFGAMEKGSSHSNAPTYTGSRKDRRLIKAYYKPEVPIQPEWKPPSVLAGFASAWLSASIHAANICVHGLARVYEALLPNALRTKG